jgi:RHS repeat-associated protein
VPRIYDSNGNVVASYLYDTWGKVVSLTDANGTPIIDPAHIGNMNPIRYRGYYYDIETGYYYLESRYYSPEWGRFLNADALFIAGSSPTGANMFVYCLNNPVMLSDPSGYDSLDATLDYETMDYLVRALLWFENLPVTSIYHEHSSIEYTKESVGYGIYKISAVVSTPGDMPRRSTKYEITSYVGTVGSWYEYLAISNERMIENPLDAILIRIRSFFMTFVGLYDPTPFSDIYSIVDSAIGIAEIPDLLQKWMVYEFNKYVRNKITGAEHDEVYGFVTTVYATSYSHGVASQRTLYFRKVFK